MILFFIWLLFFNILIGELKNPPILIRILTNMLQKISIIFPKLNQFNLNYAEKGFNNLEKGQSNLTCSMLNKVLHDFKVSVETGCPQGRGVGLGGWVDVSAAIGQKLHDLKVAGGSGTPQRGSPFYRFAVESNWTWNYIQMVIR